MTNKIAHEYWDLADYLWRDNPIAWADAFLMIGMIIQQDLEHRSCACGYTGTACPSCGRSA